MDDEYHIARLIGEDGILVAHCIVEEQFDVVLGFFGGFGLIGRDGTECHEHC